MRLGAPVPGPFDSPDAWVTAVRDAGYSAAFCPLAPDASDDEVAAYAAAAEKADIVIAEVGAWSNSISPDNAEREAALEKNRSALALADRIGARCCVNISGSRNPGKWDGSHADNLTPATFDLIVETVRGIIDAVKPTRSFYTLETMPWAYPDSVDSYLKLIGAIDRKQFAVHFDPVNLVCSPQIYFANASMIRDAFARLGPHIRSCHAKDTVLEPKLTTHLSEARPGTGSLDYGAYLAELAKLEPDVTLMIEHLPAEEYPLAADHIRSVATELGLELK